MDRLFSTSLLLALSEVYTLEIFLVLKFNVSKRMRQSSILVVLEVLHQFVPIFNFLDITVASIG